MPEKIPRNPDSEYFEYSVIAGPWKGLEARFVSQPAQMPEFADFEVREGSVIRGPIRLALREVKWIGPRK